MRSAADTLKKITLELGGKSPNIVLPDADIDAAIRGATIGIFYGKGEVCAAGSRLLVDRSRSRTSSSTSWRRARRRWSPGDPMDPKTRFGAISSKKQLETVLDYIESAKAGRGDARRRRRARRHRHRQGLLPAADGLRRRHAEMTISREEIFGPVLAAIDFADLDEAIAQRQRHALRPGRRRLDARHQEGPLRRAQAPGGHGLGQHLQRLRHGGAVRRLQAERLRPRDERARARALHAGQDGLGGSESMTGRSRTHVRFLSSLLEHFSSQGAHGAPARSGAGHGAPASDEPGFGAEPRQQ